MKSNIQFEKHQLDPSNIRVNEEELAIAVNTFHRVKTIQKNGKMEYERQPSKFRRIPWLTERYDRTNEGNKDLWRKQNLYKNYIGVINTHFMMTPYQKKISWELILKIGNLKNLCKNCRYEQIVAAICVYNMKKDNRDIRIDKNKFLKEIKLSRNRYAVIMENMAIFFEERNIFHADFNKS